MSYMALYRKWRPDEFSEVKGQEHIVTTLKNQITHDRIGHAYLFCGTRGTGKTTMAKLFAKAVNCENPAPDGSPCNECPSCKAISAGSSMNVIEMDAASNNGVDDVRKIVEEVQYSPTEGKYKVYIIDEAHMLTDHAHNALLKTLEEPPSYVIFILATTEPHKFPITILSRCQRYDFRRIDIDTIAGRLSELLEREGIKAEEKAVRYVAKAADGSMRDGLSLLDQCISFYLGKELTYDGVLEVLGAVDIDIFESLMECVCNNDTAGSLEVIDKVIWQGRELSQFVNDFIWYMRNLLLIKSADDMQERLDLSTENYKIMQERAKQIGTDALLRDIRIFSELSGQIRYATQKRIALEVAIIKLTKPQMEQDTQSLSERIRELEYKLDHMDFDNIKPRSEEASEEDEIAPYTEEELKDTMKIMLENCPAATREDMGAILEAALLGVKDDSLSEELGPITFGYMKEAKISIGSDGKSLEYAFSKEGVGDKGYLQYSKEEHKEILKKYIAEKTGKNVDIEVLSISNDIEMTKAHLNPLRFAVADNLAQKLGSSVKMVD